jgi:predicted chitinase
MIKFDKQKSIDTILAECKDQGIFSVPKLAYVLATVEHETNGTYQPVVESYWLKNPDQYNKVHHSDYYPYYGRGYVQLTWKKNYKFFGELLGKDLVSNPNLVLDPKIAAFILVFGMIHGSFTGKKLSDYINTSTTDFISARRIINGTDKAEKIARLAKAWDSKLRENNV